MKNLKFRTSYIILLSTVFILGACTKDNTTTLEVHCDVVFFNKIINDEPVTGTAYFAYSNIPLSSCTVTPPNSTQSINLAAYGINTLAFTYEPANDEFSTAIPTEGNYIFNVTSADNETIESSDEQSFSDLGFAQLDEKSFDNNNNWLYLTWGEVTGADNYTVSLINSSGETIFSGYAVNADSPEFYITTQYDFGVWTKTPTFDETYTLRIKCFKYDADATKDDYSYNIQEVSQKDYPLVWKLN